MQVSTTNIGYVVDIYSSIVMVWIIYLYYATGMICVENISSK